MTLLTGWRPYVTAAAAVGGLLVVLLFGPDFRPDDRFGDPDVLQQIGSSTDCHELQQWADVYLAATSNQWADAPPGAHATMTDDQAIGYSNAAQDRMDELGC